MEKIKSMLVAPSKDNAFNADSAKLFQTNEAQWFKVAQQHTTQHAKWFWIAAQYSYSHK